MQTGVVKRRGFLCIGGYEPIDAEWWYRRFGRELKRFEATWNVQSVMSPPIISEDGSLAVWKIDTKGADWHVETEYRLLRWDDFVKADFARSGVERVPKGIGALFDFVFSGAALRYFRTSVRYGLFFLYPFVILGGIAAFSVFLPRFFSLAGLPVPALAAFFLSVVCFFGLLYAAGRVLLLDYMFDDWIFADEFVHRTRAGLDERLDRFAREIVACARDTSRDEVIVSAHSLGAALIMDVMDRALKLDPELGKRGPVLWLMSTGSSLLKVALHPKADWLRAATDRVANAPGVNWMEYQAIVDVISFYKTDPVAEMGLKARGKPIVQQVRMRKMLKPETYKRFWGNFFRLHRQWSMGNELRYFYDYYQIICGPAPLSLRVSARDKLVDAFSENGGYNAEAAMNAVQEAARKKAAKA